MNRYTTAFDDPLWWQKSREYLLACIEGRVIPPVYKTRAK